MDAVIHFPGRAPWQGTHCNITRGFSLRCLFHKTRSNFQPGKMDIQHGITFKRKLQNKFWIDKRFFAMESNKESMTGPNPFSPSDTVELFYECINEKKLKQLGECISNDAIFEDYSFTKSFQGKKEIMKFLEQLTEGMGQNVKFRIRGICEGDDFTAAANWHLEWKKAQIPFTRGCSFFKCSKVEEKIVIRNAEVLIESPIKPGKIVLTVLKTVTSLFDDFPRATEWFLRSPHVVVKWITSVYGILIAPFVNPLVESYVKLWSFVARLFAYAFNILIYISKIFFK